MSKKITRKQLMTRYALTGGALGLYFGFFFRPVREPNLLIALLLALVITVVMTGIKAFRERPGLVDLLKAAGSTFLMSSLFLIFLELRHPIYDLGGKVAVTVVMGLMGALTGLWYAYNLIRKKGKS